jgi:protein arginine kinase activator
MPDFLFGGGGEARRADSAEKACPVCGLRGKDYRKRALLGCPACYEAFADELKPYLQAMQKGGRHTGKAPAGARLDAELEGLQAALNRAVEVQDFEEAAALRDRIRALHAAAGDGGDDAGG